MERIRGTSVAVDGVAVLLRGPSGVGKSDLALRLIDGGASLVADDFTEVEIRQGRPFAFAPKPIAGLLEVRGVGVVRLGHVDDLPLAAVIDLAADQPVARLPDAETCEILGLSLPLFRLNPFEASAAAKVRLAVRIATSHIMRAHE